MGRSWLQRVRHRAVLMLSASLAVLEMGCGTPSGAHLGERLDRAEASIAAVGLERDPAVEAARAEVEAAIAREAADVAIDRIELRAAIVHERDEKAQALARLPLRNPLELREQRRARRAESEVALARLEQVTLAQRAAGCLPTLAHRVREQLEEIFAAYARRHRALLDWNRELRNAGLVDEVRATRFELASSVKLTTRDPSGRPAPLPLDRDVAMLNALPDLGPGPGLLRTEPAVLHRELIRNQPSLAVHRARRRGYQALARRESVKRLPSPSFVDVGFEPVAYSGDERQVAARVAFEIPFGREARANQRRYEALARAERSGEQATLARRRREAEAALHEINAFRGRANDWLALATVADDSEAVADRWWRDRLAGPDEISNLLDAVYSARLAVLEARERAGRAGCTVIESTGVPPADWPR